jgi:hypothetical protein
MAEHSAGSKALNGGHGTASSCAVRLVGGAPEGAAHQYIRGKDARRGKDVAAHLDDLGSAFHSSLVSAQSRRHQWHGKQCHAPGSSGIGVLPGGFLHPKGRCRSLWP